VQNSKSGSPKSPLNPRRTETPRAGLAGGFTGVTVLMAEPTKQELYEQARQREVEGRSRMSKAELETALGEGEQPDQPPPVLPTGNWVHDHMLSIVLVGLFLVTLIGQIYFQYQHEVDQAIQHGQPAPEFFSRDYWDAFLASMFENWQSEFLQLASFVILATYLIHRGSPQSRDTEDEMAEDIKAIRKKLDA